ncbi:hypothetical protein ABZ069_23215 [Streptomyces microflavus]|uniref:hypothetical protein n=1 Tax=Streptomyces microflavus TaxID=1919 RepID=UPI0033B90842
MRHHVEITMGESSMGSIRVGGVDISDGVQSIAWRAARDECPSMELDLLIFDVTTISSKDTEILLPDETVKTLIALGWTPPEDSSGDPN